MIIIENLKRLYGLLKHTLLEKKQSKLNNLNYDSLNLYNKGYYEFNVDIGEKKFSEIVENSINKYFPETKGDRRLFAVEEESEEIKEFLFKILANHKDNIKSVSSIKKLYLHAVMAGQL